MTRKTSKAYKCLKNVADVAYHYPIDEPILCVGCGDGFEVEIFNLLGFKAFGIDVDPEKINIAKSHGLNVKLSMIEDLDPNERHNIYCAHTLEHCEKYRQVLEKLKNIMLSTMVVIIPIEKNGTNNPSHLSPIRSLSDLELKNLKMVRCYENFNYEFQGVIVWKEEVF
jgi:2-polyprenyl-3-methyl-5-hydroxy-6-metoxy-1,4-benzoquinol methylase